MQINHREIILHTFDIEGLEKQCHVRPGSGDAAELKKMIIEAELIARPRYIYREAIISERKGDDIVLEDIRFHSRVLSVNLQRVERVFAFACSCGMELEEWGRRYDDLLLSFWAEAIKEAALREAVKEFFHHIETRYHLGHVSTMSPGSLENWPISEQVPLFSLLDRPPEIELTDSLLMVPTKSISGIIFTTDESFESCQLCARENCPNRRAPYDETLYAREYCPAVR